MYKVDNYKTKNIEDLEIYLHVNYSDKIFESNINANYKSINIRGYEFSPVDVLRKMDYSSYCEERQKCFDDIFNGIIKKQLFDNAKVVHVYEITIYNLGEDGEI